MEKYKKGEIALRILEVTAAVGFVTILAALPGLGYVFKYFKPKNSRQRQSIKRSLENLKERGLLKEGGSRGSYILTQKGENLILRHHLESIKIKKNKAWDGKWRVVMFDVSEDFKQARRAVNLALKRLGCVQYQKSVFVTPFPCEQEIDFVGNAFGIRSSIKILIAEKIEGEGSLKSHFDLE